MRAQDLKKPAVPVVYGLLILELAQQRGARREALLDGLGIPERVWSSIDARLTLLQVSGLLYRALRLTGDQGLGYEIGLHSSLTTHGFITYGVMSYPTLRQGVEFGVKFLPLRLPNLQMRLREEGAYSCVEVAETTPQGAVRQAVFDLFLVGLWRIALQLQRDHAASRPGVELWFDYPEPPYYAHYRDRLPPVRFRMGSNQLRFPSALLDRPLHMANPVTAELVEQQCQRELTLLGLSGDFPARVRAALNNPAGGYGSLEEVSARLCLSSRTLKRRLREHRLGFQQLLDEVRRSDSIRLLQDGSLRVEEVAQRMAYADPANFTRAFRKWTGVTPSAYRARLGMPLA
jgi:AraC-like DNA-binding protein